MEAKDTVTQSRWPLPYENYLKDKLSQAEISFKAGQEEESTQAYNAGLWDGILRGRKEVVEWTRNNGYLIDGHTPDDLKRLKAKLKEWLE